MSARRALATPLAAGSGEGVEMARQQLSAQPRTVLGKKVKKLRREGLVPGVLYGPAVEGVRPLALTAREVERMYAYAGTSTLLDLVVDGGQPQPVLIHAVQHDALRRHLLHIDFLAPDMRVELTVTVPIALVGEAPAVETEGGVLTQLVTELQVRCLPDAIPHALEFDLSGLTEVGAQVTAGEIPLPAGVGLVSPEDELVLKVDLPQLAEPEAVEEAEETAADEAAEAAGEEPEAEAQGATEDEG
jgi:large subunit ribosomal protein L25